MRRLTLLLPLLLSVALLAHAEAAERGRIEGRVVNGTTGRPQSGVEVRLTSGNEQRRSDQVVTTDKRGRYVFDDLRTGEDRFYVVDAVYKQGLFAGRPLTLPDDTERKPVIETTLRVFEPTTDPNAILIRRHDVFAVHDESRVSIIEAVKVVNPTKSAYIGRGSALGASQGKEPVASLGFALPAGLVPETFRWVDADLDVPQAVEIDGIGFGITTAIPPGELDFTFTYQIEGEGGTFDLTRRALYEVSEMSLFAAEPLAVESNRLKERGEVELEGTVYRQFSSSESLSAADPVQILVVAEAGTSIPLVAGIVAGLIGLIAVGVLGFRRNRRPGKRRRGVSSAAPTREQTVTAIAARDLRDEAGDLEETDYRAERERLKAHLVAQAAERD